MIQASKSAKKLLREANEKERVRSRCVEKLGASTEHTVGALGIQAYGLGLIYMKNFPKWATLMDKTPWRPARGLVESALGSSSWLILLFG